MIKLKIKKTENIISKNNSNLFDNKEKDRKIKVWNINCIVNNYEGGRININNKQNQIKQT